MESLDYLPNKKNLLFYGENLLVMKKLISDFNLSGAIGFVYIDPPFSTNNTFTIHSSKANTISKVSDAEIAYKDRFEREEYLRFLKERLILIKQLMSNAASIYLHIDYKVGHYVKILMDEIFGEKNFRNDITRIKCNPKNFHRKAYGNIKDMILFYTKTDNYIWNDITIPYSEKDIHNLYTKTDNQGRRYTTIPLHAPGETKNGKTGEPWKGIAPPKGRHWRCAPRELDELDKRGLVEWSKGGNPRKIIFVSESEGKKVQDVLEYKDPQNPIYPTQKNSYLIELFINNSSSANDIVFDCFCGSGTTLLAAQNLGRRWIGIDNSKIAIETVKKQLATIQTNMFQDNIDYDVKTLI